MKQDSFKEYIKGTSTTKEKRYYSWNTSFGLQKVDGLNNSDYLKN